VRSREPWECRSSSWTEPAAARGAFCLRVSSLHRPCAVARTILELALPESWSPAQLHRSNSRTTVCLWVNCTR
jgi:hypothetical protein